MSTFEIKSGEKIRSCRMVLNGTNRTFATKDALVAVARVLPAKSVHEAHRHAQEEYLVVVEGTGTWWLNGKRQPAKRGDILYAAPWVYHGLTNTGDTPLVFLVVRYNGKGVKLPPRPDDRRDELAMEPDTGKAQNFEVSCLSCRSV